MIFTQNKMRLLRHFRKDPVLFAYHMGDLDDFYFPDCLWPTSFGAKQGIDDVLLVYSGCETPSLLAFGLTERFESLLREYLPMAPYRFFCHFQERYRGIFAEFADEHPLGTHLKMKLQDERFSECGLSDTDEEIIQLRESHLEQLRELYAAAYPDNYFVPRMLQTGHYLGILEGERLVAVAGVHVASDEHKIAVLGNVTTHPDHRGRGLATRVTHALTSRLVSEGKEVCLNVKADNTPAITCYEKIGFERVHTYEEALFTLR